MGARARRATAAVTAVVLVLVAGTAATGPAGAGVAAAPTIQGRITDTGGAPVAGAVVGSYLPTDGLAPSSFGVTAADGTYTLLGVGVGENRVVAVPQPASGLALPSGVLMAAEKLGSAGFGG